MNLTRGETEKLLIALPVSIARTTGSDALHVPAIPSLVAWNADCSRSDQRDVDNAHAEFLTRVGRSRSAPPRGRQGETLRALVGR